MIKRTTFTFAAICSALVASGAAIAADMAVKAPRTVPSLPPGAAPVYSSWTGWYVGGNVGDSWGDANTNFVGSATTTSSFNAANPLMGGGSFTNPFAFADSAARRLQGVVGGGQLGYNYQINPRWVLGFETDIQASGERANNTLTTPFAGPLCGSTMVPGTCAVFFPTPLNGVALTSDEAKIDWFGTVRGRVGWLLNDVLLVYGTGGLAYGQVNVSGNVNVSAAIPGAVTFGPGISAFSQSKTNIGFAAGAGLEGRLVPWGVPNWTWKLEYLFVDLGSLDTSTSFAAVAGGPGGAFFTPLAGTMTTHTRFTDNIVRVGLNYHFN